MIPKFKVGDYILHPGYGKVYSIDYVGKKEYRLSTATETHIYLQFINEDGFRLCDEQTVDRILTKYTNDDASS